jgi:hypothetical protein
MNSVFHDHEDPANTLNGRGLTSSEAIRLLRSLRTRDPFFCSFETNAGTLLVGVGPDVGCVQFTPKAGGPPYLMAVNDSIGSSDEYVEFLSGGTPSPVPRRYSLPWPLLERIVTDVLDRGAIPNDAVWEEI